MKKILNWLNNHKIKLGLGLLSFCGYGFFFGWKVSIFIMLAIMIHEYGHFLAMQLSNLKNGGIYLIPFFGGATILKENYRSYWQATIVALAGPAIGSLLALLLVALGKVTHQPIFEAAALLTMVINLFNMIPTLPLDGGHWLKSICFSLRPVVGLSIFVIVCLTIMGLSIPYLGFLAPVICLFGASQLALEGYFFVKRHDPKYDKTNIPHLLRFQPIALTKMQILYSVLIYVGICVSLLLTAFLTKDLDVGHLSSYFR